MRYQQFNKLFDASLATVQRDARAAYKQFVADSSHPRLYLETVHGKRGHIYYSVRVGLHAAAHKQGADVAGIFQAEALKHWIGVGGVRRAGETGMEGSKWMPDAFE